MEYDFIASHIKRSENKICDSLSRLPVPPRGSTMASSPAHVSHKVTSDELEATMSIKCVQDEAKIDSAVGIMDTVKCLAKLPVPTVEVVSIAKVIGNTAADVWNHMPLTAKDVATATREDKVLGKLATSIRSGVLNKQDADLKPFVSVFDNLYIEQEVIFHGQRIVIPSRQRARLLDKLHNIHMGVCAMKEVA